MKKEKTEAMRKIQDALIDLTNVLRDIDSIALLEQTEGSVDIAEEICDAYWMIADAKEALEGVYD